MSDLVRVGISLPGSLLGSFDWRIIDQGYTNRSEAIRDLIRDSLVENQWDEGGGESVAAVSIVYDHHSSDLSKRLTALQHDTFLTVMSTVHFHLDHHNCLEIIVLRGEVTELRRIADRLTTLKGVKVGRVSYLSTGEALT